MITKCVFSILGLLLLISLPEARATKLAIPSENFRSYCARILSIGPQNEEELKFQEHLENSFNRAIIEHDRTTALRYIALFRGLPIESKAKEDLLEQTRLVYAKAFWDHEEEAELTEQDLAIRKNLWDFVHTRNNQLADAVTHALIPGLSPGLAETAKKHEPLLLFKTIYAVSSLLDDAIRHSEGKTVQLMADGSIKISDQLFLTEVDVEREIALMTEIRERKTTNELLQWILHATAEQPYLFKNAEALAYNSKETIFIPTKNKGDTSDPKWFFKRWNNRRRAPMLLSL